jgi:hypothetical protein
MACPADVSRAGSAFSACQAEPWRGRREPVAVIVCRADTIVAIHLGDSLIAFTNGRAVGGRMTGDRHVRS